MANSTFSGAVRSESTFKTVSKNSTTGAITDNYAWRWAIGLADSNVTLTNATLGEFYLFQMAVKMTHTLYQPNSWLYVWVCVRRWSG